VMNCKIFKKKKMGKLGISYPNSSEFFRGFSLVDKFYVSYI